MAYIGSLGSNVEQSSLYQVVQTYMLGERQQLQRFQASKSENSEQIATFTTLSSKLKKLSDAIDDFRWTGSLSPLSSFTASATTEAVSVAVDGNASEGVHTLQVHTLAKAHSVASNAFLGDAQSTMAGEHVLELVQGGDTHKVSVTVKEGATQREALLAIANAINSSPAKISASLVQTDSRTGEYRILMTSRETGTQSIIQSVRDLSGELATSLGLRGESTGIDFAANTVQAAADATFSVNGLEFTSFSNNVEHAIRGLTLQIEEVTSDPVTVTVSRDVEAVRGSLDAFITAFNELLDHVRTLTQGADAEGEGRGRMTGNSLFMNLRTGLRSLVGSQVSGADLSGGFTSLARIGITTTTEGRLRVSDEKALEDAILNGADGLEHLFGDSQAGIAVRLYDTIRGYVKSGGLISQERSLIHRQQRTLDARIAQEEAYLERREQQLTEQLAGLQATFQQLSAQRTMVQSMGSTTDLASFLSGSM